MAFECGICTSMFNAAQRQPLILECGHTFCRPCIQHNLGPQKWCPYCRQPINKHVDDLPRNYALENAMEAANVPLMELMDRWGLANAERMMVKPDQLQLTNLLSRKGNTGEVWRGTLWGKAVAIKLLPLVGVDDRQLDCLRREVAVLLHTTGECKQVCIYKGFCVKGGNFAIIMKLYSYSLAARVARHPGRRLPLPLAMKYSVDIAKGLVELHRLGVTGADLKPDNVLIDDELGDAVIADFGISSVVTCSIGVASAAAARHRRGTSGGLRSSGVMRGTPNYMAPEQFTPGHKPTNKVDIWGFAATLLHMLTGAPPWQHETLLQICTAVGVYKQSPPLPEGLPQQLEALMKSCFEADPAKRPTAAHLLKALQAMGPVLECPQLMRATSNLKRNSQLLAAARGVLVGLQQDCCQLVQQLDEGEDDPAAAGPEGLSLAAAGCHRRLESVVEEVDEEQKQQNLLQDSHGDQQTPAGVDDKQAGLDQYFAQLGLLSLLSRESSHGMPSAPPLPDSSSSSSSCNSRPGSSHSSKGGISLNLNAIVNGSKGSNKLPKVLWTEEEAWKEEQEAQQQRQQQQQLQQQGVAAGMGLTSPRKIHHSRCASEQVAGSRSGYTAAAHLCFDPAQDPPQQQQQQVVQLGVCGGQAEQHQHNRSISEVCHIWGARELPGDGSKQGQADVVLRQQRRSSFGGAEELGKAECGASNGFTDVGNAAADRSPNRQRKQWQIPAAAQQQYGDCVQQQQQQQQQQSAVHMHGQSKWPGGLGTATGHLSKDTPGIHQQQSLSTAGCSKAAGSIDGCAGPLTAAAAAHRSQHSMNGFSAGDSLHPSDGNAVVEAAPSGPASRNSSSSQFVPPPSSPRKHSRTLSSLLMGRGGSSVPSSPCPSPGKASGLSIADVDRSSRTPEKHTRQGGVAGGSSILAGAAVTAGVAAGVMAVGAAAVGAGLAGCATTAVAAAGGGGVAACAGAGNAAAAGIAAAVGVGMSKGAAEAGKIVSPGLVATLASKFSTGSSSSSPKQAMKPMAEPRSPDKVVKTSRWRRLFGESPAKKRSQTPQHELTSAAASSASVDSSSIQDYTSTYSRSGSPALDCKSSNKAVACSVEQQTAPTCNGRLPIPDAASKLAPSAAESEPAVPPKHSNGFTAPQQLPLTAADAACFVAATAPGMPTLHRSPLRGQDHPAECDTSNCKAAAPAAAATCSKVQLATSSATAAAQAADTGQGGCSPLRSHMRNLSLSSCKVPGLGASANGGVSPSRGDAISARSPSPQKQQLQQQQQSGCSDAKQSSLCTTASLPAADQHNSIHPRCQPNGSATSSTVGQSHSAMLAEASSLEGLARQLSASGRKDEAEAALRSSLAILTQHLGSSHPNSVAATTRLALHLNRNGKASEAEGLFRQVLMRKQAMLGKKHPQVAVACNNLAACLYSQGSYAAAAKMYGSVLEIRRSALGEQHVDTAACMNNLALCNSRLGQHAEAEPLYKQALTIRTAALGQTHPEVAATAHSLGHCLNQLGRHSEALVHHKQGLWIRQQVENSNGSSMGSRTAAADGGRTGLQEGVAAGRTRRTAGGSSEDVVASHRSVAMCLAKLGCDSQAEEHFGHVLEARTGDILALAVPPPPGVDHPLGTSAVGSSAAGRHSMQASFAAALGVSGNGQVDDVDWSFLADGDSRLSKPQQDALLAMATAAEELARCCSRQGKHGNAEELYWQALEARSQVLGSRHELVQATEELLKDCLDRQC